MLTFELSPDGDMLEIYCNDEGIDELIRTLTNLRASKARPQHDHWMTPSWSGHELTEELHSNKNKLIHMVTIRLLAAGRGRG